MATLSTGLSFNTVNDSVAKIVTARETDLKNTITDLPENPSTSDMLKMQQQVQQWTISTQIQSTIVQSVAEAIKGVIQKSG